MQRPDFSQSPKRVGSGPSRPPISRGGRHGRQLRLTARLVGPGAGQAAGVEPGGGCSSCGGFMIQPAILPDAAYVHHRRLGYGHAVQDKNRARPPMTDEPTEAIHAVPLPGFGVLRVGGADAGRFLQGQLTNDVQLLDDGRTLARRLLHPAGPRDRTAGSTRPTTRSTPCARGPA